MAVYDQSYLPWSGTYGPRAARVWALVRPGLLAPFRNTWVLLVVTLAFVMVGGWLLLLFVMASSQMPQLFAIGNNIYRAEFYNNYFFSLILAVLATTVGAPLISQDLRYNALLMYFSRAITRTDYLIGKFLTLSLFLLTFATLGPGILLWLGQLAYGTEKITMAQRLGDLASIALHSIILVVPMSAVVLACSSLTPRPYVAGILWATIFFASTGFSKILLDTLKKDWCGLLSWTRLTAHLGDFCYSSRPLKPGLLSGPSEPALQAGWVEPLLILSAMTACCLGLARWRLRVVEARE